MAIPTVEEATIKLQELLGKINESASDAQLNKVADALVDFRNPLKSKVPATAPYAQLRETARLTREDLDRQLSGAAIRRIEARTEDLNRYLAAMSAITAEAEHNAQALRLETITLVVKGATQAARDLREAIKAFQENRTDDGFAAIDRVLGQIEELNEKVVT